MELVFRETVIILDCLFLRPPPSPVSCKVLLSQEGDNEDKKPLGGVVSDREGDRVMRLVFRETVIMLRWTCNFFGRPTFPLFFRFFGALFFKKKEVIFVLLVHFCTSEQGDMSFDTK